MPETVIVALITGGLALCGTLGGSYLANRRAAALIAYRLQQLEDKVKAHNRLVERMYDAEKRLDVLEQKSEDADRLQEERIRVANHRIEDLERHG